MGACRGAGATPSSVARCTFRGEDFTTVAGAPEWCLGAPVPRSPGGARVPPTIDRPATGPPAHTTRARRDVRFEARRDAAHRGPLEASVTDLRTDFGADEGSARKIPIGGHEPSNHDLSASSRNASRRDSSFEHRHPSIASPTHAGRRSFVSAKTLRGRPGSAWGTQSGAGKTEGEGERRATAAVPSSGSAPDRWPSSVRSRADGCRSPGGSGNRESAASGPVGHRAGGSPRVPTGILPASPSRVQAARTGEVLRSRDQGASSVP